MGNPYRPPLDRLASRRPGLVLQLRSLPLWQLAALGIGSGLWLGFCSDAVEHGAAAASARLDEVHAASGAPAEPEAAPEPEPPMTPERYLASYLAKRYESSPERVKSAELQTAPHGTTQASIAVKGYENLTIGMARTGALLEARDIIRDLSKAPEMSAIDFYNVAIYLDFTDVYQRTSDGLALRAQMSAADARQVNWDGVYGPQFERLTRARGDLFVHPSMDGD